MDPAVHDFLQRAPRWRDEMAQLRALALDCGLTEALKWGKPCFMADGQNVAILQPFKERCALMFFQGALLGDPDGVLERQGEHSHAARRLTFAGLDEVARQAPLVRRLLAEAAVVAQSGQPLPPRVTSTPVPEELTAAFGRQPGLQAAFEALTPGRQRAYLLHFGGAKQSATRAARIQRCAARILAGLGLDD